MSYGRSQEKKYAQQPSPSLQRGKGFKPKGDFEKDLISKSSESQIKTGESKGTSE
jgi:hypothetical protein